MQHYNYFRSSTSHRLRIALNLKGVVAEYIAVDLVAEANLQDAFKALNPQGLVPALILDNKDVLTQSPAIIEWLEERYPEPPLLPRDPQARAQVRALAALVSCDIHPVNNRRILQYLRQQFGANEAAVNAWCAHWITAGFEAYEALLAQQSHSGAFSWGDSPTMADVYLVPQVESARRFKVDLGRWPRIMAIDTLCANVDAFASASPWEQPDAPEKN